MSYLGNTSGLEFIKDFNIFMVGWLLGIILGFVATHIDISDQIDKGYVQNLFKGKVIVTDTKNINKEKEEN